ncbi:TRIM56 [Mytilus coruscus]|uniref:TRIM56 n=1 Tax=Mytilus coruscus TaxID=42192 RepID=A0A6J8BYE3_MYTCO|nr:TRIM56 [Mytilus coruscus]
MATAEVSSCTINDDITTCTICLEQFNIPKYLPCLHSFCESCIEIYITSAFEKENTFINCPVCRSKVSAPESSITPEQWAKRLPLNFLLVGLIEKHKVERPEKICMSCERIDVNKKSEAISVCIDCCDTLCSNCLNCHRINKSSSNHEIVDISKQGIVLKSFKNICTEHKGKELELFCADHDLPCCATCVSVKHRKCENILVIDDAAKKFRETTSVYNIKTAVTTLLAEMEINLQSERKSLDKVQESAVSQLNTFNEFWTHLEQTIDKIRRNKTNQYQVQFEIEKSKIQASIDSIENKQKTVTNSRQILEVAEREASDVQVMIEVKKIKRQIEQCKFELQRKCDICEIEFQFTKNVDEVDSIFEKICILNCNRLNTVNVSSIKSRENIVHSSSSEFEINSELDQEREYNCRPEKVASQHKMMPDFREQNVVTMQHVQEETLQELPYKERIRDCQKETVHTRKNKMVKDEPVEAEVWSDEPVQVMDWPDALVEAKGWSDEPVQVMDWPEKPVEANVWTDEPVHVKYLPYEPVECKQDYVTNKQPKKVHRPKSVATRQQDTETTRKPDNGSEWLRKSNMQLERAHNCQMEEVLTEKIEVENEGHPEPVEWKTNVAANQSGKLHVTRPLSLATRLQEKEITSKSDNACEWQQQMKQTCHWQRNTIPTEKMEINSVYVEDEKEQNVYQSHNHNLANELLESEKERPQEYIPDWQQHKVENSSYEERRIGRKESNAKTERKSKNRR